MSDERQSEKGSNSDDITSESKKGPPEDRRKPLPDGEAIAEVGDAVGGPA